MMIWYGVYGQNGYGIYTDWNLVLKSKPYISGFKVKKFKTFKETKDYVIKGLESLDGLDSFSEIDFARRNWFYRLYKLKEVGKETSE